MSSINGVSSSSNPWAALKTHRSEMQAKMMAKVDTDSSGSVDQAELQTMLSDISQKTGMRIDSNGADTFSKMDSNADGTLSSDEVDKGMHNLMPAPPSTMDFAQSRSTDSTGGSAGSQDDLFAKVDTNGDGALTQAELEAGRPQGGAQDPDGPPPPGGPGGPGGAGGVRKSESTSNQAYDPLDTNKDGTVSELERLAGEIAKLATSSSETSSTDGKDHSNTLTEQTVAALAKMVYAQIAAGFSQTDQGRLDATA